MSYSGVLPKTKSDKALSNRHLKDTVKFNKRHMQDHAKEMKKAQKELSKR